MLAINKFGYRRSQFVDDVPRFSAVKAAPKVFHDVNSIRAAAASMHPIYAAIEAMDDNDRRSNCTAVAAHKIQTIFDCAAGRQWRLPSVTDVDWTYSQTTAPPFNPATGANDNGAEMETVLSFWHIHGLFQDGYGKIKAAYAVDATNKAEVIAALESNGVLYAGCMLPKAIENIRGTGFIWGGLGPPDPTLGHCMLIYGYNSVGVFVSTWGMQGTIPWEWFAFYFGGRTGEVYTVVAA
jgi:hypothetical protein